MPWVFRRQNGPLTVEQVAQLSEYLPAPAAPPRLDAADRHDAAHSYHYLTTAVAALPGVGKVETRPVLRTVATTSPHHDTSLECDMTTLVIGARGAVGRHVLNQLIAVGEPVRASVRVLSTADFPEEVSVVERCGGSRRSRLGPSSLGFAESPIVDAIIELIAAATEGGSPATSTAQDVLGRPPTPFAQWARDHAADFAR